MLERPIVSKVIAGILATLLFAITPLQAAAQSVPCRCIVSAADEAGKTIPTKQVGSLSAGNVTADVSGAAVCTQSCTQASNSPAVTTAFKDTVANASCGSNSTGTVLKFFSAPQGLPFSYVRTLGTLISTPPQYDCKCGSGYSIHFGVQTGGANASAKCTKIVGTLSEAPPNMTYIGSNNWGVVFNSQVFKYGTDASCTKTTERVCKLQ